VGKLSSTNFPNNNLGMNRPIDSHFIRKGPTENYASNNSSNVACIRCQGDVYTESLPSNDTLVYDFSLIDEEES
jgi:hypothetical protein